MKTALKSIGMLSIAGLMCAPLVGCEEPYEERGEAIEEYGDEIESGETVGEAREEALDELE